MKEFQALVRQLSSGHFSTSTLSRDLKKIADQQKKEFEKTVLKVFGKEKTLTIIKPDAVEQRQIGRVITRLEKVNIKPVAMKMIRINKLQANLFYGHLKKKIPKTVFESIVDYMTSNRVVLIVWQGPGVTKQVHQLCGPTDPKKASKENIRSISKDDMQKEFKKGKAVKNIIHSSETKEDALKEISFFFLPWEIHA